MVRGETYVARRGRESPTLDQRGAEHDGGGMGSCDEDGKQRLKQEDARRKKEKKQTGGWVSRTR